MTKLALLSAALLLLAEPYVAASRCAAVALATAADLVRDDAVQAKIAAVASATGEDQRESALEALRRAVSPDYEDLVPQLALFLLAAEGERAGMTPALIVSRLGISRGQILRAVEPHLDTPDPALRAQLENLLGAVELGDVRVFLVERGAPPSEALVRYLYARSPADAVAVLAVAAGRDARITSLVPQVEEARAALAAGSASEEKTARAAAALDELARHPDWWLRAYAAAVLRAQAQLAATDGAALARLADDPERRVRAVAGGSRVTRPR